MPKRAPPKSDPSSELRSVLDAVKSLPPDPCGAQPAENAASANLEDSALQIAENAVLQKLNATAATPEGAERSASDALQFLEAISASINASWPDANRLHCKILNVSPALVVKINIRTSASFFIVGAPEKKTSQRDRHWKIVGAGLSLEHSGATIRVDLYPLRRGPSRYARFLVRYEYSGCAGSIGLAYEADEWNPAGAGELGQIIRQDGALGLDDNVRGFPQIGKLRTDGPTIALPFCRFSAIDTWDNPSLCAVDTYDVSGDEVWFQSRRYNRPDLVPVAKAIEYAGQRDYRAVIGYCASPEIARKLVRDFPSGVVADDIQVNRVGPGMERVRMSFDSSYEFDLELHTGRWQVTGFNIN